MGRAKRNPSSCAVWWVSPAFAGVNPPCGGAARRHPLDFDAVDRVGVEPQMALDARAAGRADQRSVIRHHPGRAEPMRRKAPRFPPYVTRPEAMGFAGAQPILQTAAVAGRADQRSVIRRHPRRAEAMRRKALRFSALRILGRQRWVSLASTHPTSRDLIVPTMTSRLPTWLAWPTTSRAATRSTMRAASERIAAHSWSTSSSLIPRAARGWRAPARCAR